MKRFLAVLVFGLLAGALCVALVAAFERAQEVPPETPLGCAAIRRTEIEELIRTCDDARPPELDPLVGLAWCRVLALRFHCPRAVQR